MVMVSLWLKCTLLLSSGQDQEEASGRCVCACTREMSALKPSKTNQEDTKHVRVQHEARAISQCSSPVGSLLETLETPLIRAQPLPGLGHHLQTEASQELCPAPSELYKATKYNTERQLTAEHNDSLLQAACGDSHQTRIQAKCDALNFSETQ